MRDPATDGFGSEVIVDNTDTGFSSTGTWTSATAISGYYGTDYLTHPANQAPASASVVDNDTAGTSMTGTWNTNTSGAVAPTPASAPPPAPATTPIPGPCR